MYTKWFGLIYLATKDVLEVRSHFSQAGVFLKIPRYTGPDMVKKLRRTIFLMFDLLSDMMSTVTTSLEQTTVSSTTLPVETTTEGTFIKKKD